MSSASSSSNSSASVAGPITTFVIFLVVVGCIGLIGLSGFVKYQIDRAEARLAAPELELTPEQQEFEKIRRELGYSGFVGFAQAFAVTHDAANLNDMRGYLKQASDSLEKLPEKAGSDARHDLQAMVAIFIATMQKAERAAATPPTADFVPGDLQPLYATLPVLDARVASILASNRLAEQDQMQFWSMVLTVICWGSLIIASGLAAGIYLILRDRNSAPMRALAQSVKNMARGDMRTTIWGTERQDAIGDLARSVDQARFHFSQLPDMSLLSEQGPVRIRFEGNTRSLFEAMMRVISRDSEQVHEQANSLTEAVVKQRETLAHVVERVEAVLQSVEKRAVSGDQQVRQALQGMLGSAESLKNAQEHASDQLNRIIPFLQERSDNLSEITQITGKQVAQALQSIALTERGLRTSAEQSEEAIRKFSTTADSLGERMFGAVNLLQASGKVLAETTETTKSRFDEAIERLHVVVPQNDEPPAPLTAALDEATAQRLEGAVVSLESAHAKLAELLSEQAEAAKMHVDLISTQSSGLLTQASTASFTLSNASDRLREMLDALAAQVEAQAAAEQKESDIAPLLITLTEGFGTVERGIAMLQEQITALQPRPLTDEESEQMRDHWYQMAGQIEASRASLEQVVLQQTSKVEAHIASVSGAPADADAVRETQSQLEQQTLVLNELVATLGLLDAHMQELRNQVAVRLRVG